MLNHYHHKSQCIIRIIGNKCWLSKSATPAAQCYGDKRPLQIWRQIKKQFATVERHDVIGPSARRVTDEGRGRVADAHRVLIYLSSPMCAATAIGGGGGGAATTEEGKVGERGTEAVAAARI
jgi:hypothetical protein